MDRGCQRCLESYIHEGSYEEHVKSYISSIPDEIKTPPAEYSRRLDICRGCSELSGRVCRMCGCFVEMRAAKKVMYCPLSYDKW